MQTRRALLRLLSRVISTVFAACLLTSCEKTNTPESPTEVIIAKHGAELVRIPGGWFEMGSAANDTDETPVHRVWVDSFLMDRYEMSQELYTKVVPPNPAHFKGPRRPVEQITWADAALYCNKRSRDEGLAPCYDEETAACNFAANGYRLPTEAEWEYACRAGSSGAYSCGKDPRHLKSYAWFADNAAKTTHPVGQRKPNAWGLYDMHGNVAEWCNDVYAEKYYQSSPEKNPRGPDDGEKYALRGGAWNSTAKACRSACRAGEDPGFQDACFSRDAIGFRCVRRAHVTDKQQARARPAGRATAYTAAAEPPLEMPSPPTGFVYDPIYLEHKTGSGHPERPERLTAIVGHLKKQGLLANLTGIKPRPAALEWLTTVHSAAYVERVKRSCQQKTPYFDTRDVAVSAQSYEAACAAAGGVLAAVDAVMAGKIRNAFCAVRPPGHHALRERAMGFCLFNNVAIAARYLQKKHKLARILIIDWDVHHGNGTQAMFYDDPTVFYFGIHQSPFYPGTGSADEKGEGPGLNFTLNVPVPPGRGDKHYRSVFHTVLKPRALAFKPDFVLISAGFDHIEGDLLGGMRVSSKGCGALTRTVMEIAATCSKGRLVSVLEGGYHLDRMAHAVEAHLRALMD